MVGCVAKTLEGQELSYQSALVMQLLQKFDTRILLELGSTKAILIRPRQVKIAIALAHRHPCP